MPLIALNQVISSTIEIKDLLNVVTNIVAETFGYKEFAILPEQAPAFDQRAERVDNQGRH